MEQLKGCEKELTVTWLIDLLVTVTLAQNNEDESI